MRASKLSMLIIIPFVTTACVTTLPHSASTPTLAAPAQTPYTANTKDSPQNFGDCRADSPLSPCQAFFDATCARDPLYCSALAMQPVMARLGDKLLPPLLSICQEDVVVACGLISRQRFAAARYDDLAESIDQELCLNGMDVRARSLLSPQVNGMMSRDELRQAAQAMSDEACQRLDRTYHSFLSQAPE